MNVCISQMIYFDRIDVSEGSDVNKAAASNECDICHYWCFLISKNEAIKLMQNSDLTEKTGTL